MLEAWAASSTRFREDANAEEALAVGGYAGRVLIELASNAVDAARDSGAPARIRVRMVDDELLVANTGSPLTAAGVSALASLRASAKRDTPGSVGHFGVGFTAVLSWSSAPRVVSTSGGVRFGEDDTRAAIAVLSNPALDREVALRSGQVPVLRLPWPTRSTEPAPPSGYQSEVRLPLRPGLAAEVAAVLANPDTPGDLFWALAELTEIDLPGVVARRSMDDEGMTVIRSEPRPGSIEAGTAVTTVRRFRTVTSIGDIPADLLAGRPVEERRRDRWRVTWALPVADDANGEDLQASARSLLEPSPGPVSIIGAPTPTDEPITLPARLIGTFPVDDTRRRLAVGPLLDYLLDRAAAGYLELIAGAAPAQRWKLFPSNGFPAGSIDAELRGRIGERVAGTPLLVTAAGDLVSPADACMLPGAGEQGTTLVGQAVPGLLGPQPVAAVGVLRALGVSTVGWAQASGALAGIDRPPTFWWEVYQAVQDAQPQPHPEEVADIPVPLTGGRRALGPRGCLLPAPRPATAPGTDDGSVAGWPRVDEAVARRFAEVVPGARVVEPAAAHPFLEHLGARPAEPATLLADPGLLAVVSGLRADLEHDDDLDPGEVAEVAKVVLDLLAADPGVATGPDALPNVVLAQLVLTDADGQAWPAAELLMPGAPLASVLADDVDLPLIDARWTDRYSRDVLTAAGVRWGFAVVTVVEPDGPGGRGDLPDLDGWLAATDWSGERAARLPDRPETVTGLADLDLVDADRWPAALMLISRDRQARSCLSAPAGSSGRLSYTGWWVSRYGRIADRPPGWWRLPGAVDLEGLYDPVPIELERWVAESIGVRAGLAAAATADPQDLLDRWGDPDRPLPAGRVAAVTAAVVAGMESLDRRDLPPGVRTLSGDVLNSEDADVLDEPWWVQVLPASRLVAGGADPTRVASVLDLPVASASNRALIVADPIAGPRSALMGQARERLARAAAALGVIGPADVVIAAGLRVGVNGAEPVTVRWWGAGDRYWIDGSAEAAGAVLAWSVGNWAARQLAVAAAAQDGRVIAEDGLG